MSDFPTLVYRSPGPHHGPNGTTYDYRGVADEAAKEALIAEGWHESFAVAVGLEQKAKPAEAPEQIDDSAPTREELELKATELGIKFDGRTTDAALSKKIDAALSEQP